MYWFKLCVLVLFALGNSVALFIDGCPMFGCRPSGSFSFYQKIPTSNVTVNWISDAKLESVPEVLGCVADSVNIICQSNGPFNEDRGYISLYGENGSIRWRDKVLKFPTLPLLDNYGDVTGSDGVKLVHYDILGKLFPIIKCYGLRPMFSMQLVSGMYLLLVSERGALVVRDTNAIPVATIFLNDTVQRINGTFLPIAQPVVNGSRFYLLTEFVPEIDEYDPTVWSMQRLYAIDIHHRMADIITVAWFFNFEMETNSKYMRNANDGKTKPDMLFQMRKDIVKKISENIVSKQCLIWDNARSTIYVSLPPPYTSNRPSSFWGFSDKGNDVDHLFRSDIDITHMATFEPDSYTENDLNQQILWVSTSDSTIHSVRPDGNISSTIDLQSLLKATVTITSKLALVRANNTSSSYLVFGITVSQPTEKFKHILQLFGSSMEATSFVITIATNQPIRRVQWLVPVPDNMQVKGQLSGSRGASFRSKDQIVFYAETHNKTAKIISIH